MQSVPKKSLVTNTGCFPLTCLINQNIYGHFLLNCSMSKNLNPNHIPGIYNYCDRWCERCSFTSCCAVYERTGNLSPEQSDVKNRAFWKNISTSFSEALILLEEAAKQEGVDIKQLTDGEWEIYKRQQAAGRAKAKDHPIIKHSRDYGIQTMAVLQKNELLKQQAAAIIQQADLGIKNTPDAKAELYKIADCLEVVQWYVFQIQVKFMRALPMMPGEAEDDNFKNDSNGSAKVALIAVDRCLNAWQKIFTILPAAEDEIIPLLALLQKIRRIGEATFPDARDFIRVGLDD